MRLSSVLKATLPAGLAAGLVLANCTGQMAGGGGDLPGGTEVSPACDPDGYAPCPDDYFVCVEDDTGNKRCEGQLPAVPDDGVWECYEEGTTLVCRGDHMPTDDGYWDCEQLGDVVVCRGHAYVPNDGGADGSWDCWYEGEFRVCESGEGGGSGDEDAGGGGGGGGGGGDWWDDWFPDGVDEEWLDGIEDLFDDLFDGDGGGGDADTDGDTDGDSDGDEGGDDCVCVPGAWRYCDTPTYCRWGVQHCDTRGMDWGPCTETGIPAECGTIDSWYSPEAEACCIEAGFCCQDMWDRDRDGNTWESLGDCVDIECV